MKVTREEKFTPVTIILENQDEIDILFALSNFFSIPKVLGYPPALTTLCEGLNPLRMNYEKWHEMLEKDIYYKI